MMHGQCLCGDVKFEILGNLPRLYQCHCSLCRKQTGTSSNTATIVSKDNFRWLAGKDKISSWVKGTGYRSDFCSTCGSPVPNPLHNSPYLWVPIGLLDSSEQQLEVVVHLFVDSKASWDIIDQSGVQYEESAPEFADFIALLHANNHA